MTEKETGNAQPGACVDVLPRCFRVHAHDRGECETRVTGDEPQGTMGRVQTAGEAPFRPLSPSRLPLRAHFHRERERSLGTRQI